MSRRFVYFQGEGRLPFSIIIIIDASGSLSPEDVPQVYTAVDLIKANLVSLGSFPDETAANSFVRIIDDETNERYLRWYAQFPAQMATETGSSSFVIINFQDEAAGGVYHNNFLNANNSNHFYNQDNTSLAQLIGPNAATDQFEILGAKIFVPNASPQNSSQFWFLNNEDEETTHLWMVFNNPPAGNYNFPTLGTFYQNRFELPVMEYELLIDRASFTTAYVYNKMAQYLNVYFALTEFSLLPLL